jgi:hypothetical protein
MRLVQQFGQFPLRARVGRRAEETEHDPASGRDVKVERPAGKCARGKPRDGIAEDEFHGPKSPEKGSGTSDEYG